MMTFSAIIRGMEGAGLRRWYIALSGPVRILGGPYKTRHDGVMAVFRLAHEAGDPKPWPQLDTFEGYPGFAALHTGLEVYYVGRASAMHDQGDEWGAAISAYEEEKGIR